jgi:tetratricopeptide (TPR) repeat protein
MGFFSRRQNSHALPGDIISMMERFGRFEFDPQLTSGGTMDTWWPQLPTPSQGEKEISNPTNIHDSPEAWVEAGIAHMQNARYAEALSAFDRALQLDPNRIVVWYFKGLALKKLRRYKEALASYDRALSLDPNNALAWNNKGVILRALGRTAEAEQAFQKARKLGK